MAINVRDRDDGAHRSAGQLLARAAAVDARADVRLSATINDFFLPDDARLDDRMRAGIGQVLIGLVSGVEAALTQRAGRLLSARDLASTATRLVQPGTSVLDRLLSAGLLRDPDLMRELIARVRQDAIGDGLPAAAPLQPETPSLLARLANHPDTVVADAASALFAADGRRRGLIDGVAQTDLPAELHHRLMWWVAAALRERAAHEDDLAELDRALAEAALRSLAAHDEADRLEAAAMRLAVAYEAAPGELPDLLGEALGDRRLALFTAFLAQAAGLDYDQARDMVGDAETAHLWLVLRALDCPRGAIARIGLGLCEADPRRDVERFADMLDDIMDITPPEARAALAPLKLPQAYRAAMTALGQGHGGVRGA
jgi:hypothetical protein